jgi:hypothetical protein
MKLKVFFKNHFLRRGSVDAYRKICLPSSFLQDKDFCYQYLEIVYPFQAEASLMAYFRCKMVQVVPQFTCKQQECSVRSLNSAGSKQYSADEGLKDRKLLQSAVENH